MVKLIVLVVTTETSAHPELPVRRALLQVPRTSCDRGTGREDTEATSQGESTDGLKSVNQKKKKVTQSAYYVEYPGETVGR